jgi:hypothetical protein
MELKHIRINQLTLIITQKIRVENLHPQQKRMVNRFGVGSPRDGGNNGGVSPDLNTDKQYVAFERNFLRELTQSNME